MILFVTTAFHRYTLSRTARQTIGRGVLQVVSYDWLFRQPAIRASCVIFTDFDRLRHFELAEAGRCYRQLREGGIHVLNDPARARQRHDLLHTLHAAGVNRFQAWQAVLRPKPDRFPVFVKCETDHRQAFDELIADQPALDRKLDEIEADGMSLRDLLVIEFANEPIRDDVFHRKTVYRVGDRIIPGVPVVEDKPFVKYGRIEVAREEDFVTFAEWMRSNPEGEQLRRVFDIARIDYGRADYVSGPEGLAVFEINTNPTVRARFPEQNAAFLKVARDRFDELTEAIRSLDGEDRTVSLDRGKARSSRLRLVAGFFLKMP